ncbi:MAG: OmpA family protein [Deltaproteobacteria bacterium]|nr:OmpA family protein [Deltaproteobacteria bacterium]
MIKKRKDADRPRVIIKKVKAKHGGGHSGGAWKVAYADFVTAMMALFIVLWITAATETSVKVGLAQYFRDPGVFKRSAGILPDGQGGILSDNPGKTSPLEELQGRLTKELLDLEEFASIQDQILIHLGPKGLTIEMIDKDKHAFFALGSAELNPDLLRILERIVHQIKNIPNKIAISGHTDALLYQDGSFYSNWDLSAARALNTRRAMENFGLDPAQVARVTGHADQSPLFPDEPLNPGNRRINILVLRNDPSTQSPSANSPASSEDLSHQ